MRVQDVMTASVKTVGPDTSIAEAAGIMIEHRISGLPVVDPLGALVGIVTEQDLLRRPELATQRKRSGWLEFFMSPGRLADEYAQSHGRRVETVMTSPVHSTSPEAPLDDVVKEMELHHVKRMPVTVHGTLVGVVSRSDLLRALAASLVRDTATVSDGDIERDIMTALNRQNWTRDSAIKVRAERGVVFLTGQVSDERQRLAAQVLAENCAGVKEVVDQLAWIEPRSQGAMTDPL